MELANQLLPLAISARQFGVALPNVQRSQGGRNGFNLSIPTMKTKLQKELESFVMWLTPCGQVASPPSIEFIGREARKLLRKIILSKKRKQ